jgi:uncharacterized repeat protein (TIGR03803 family)
MKMISDLTHVLSACAVAAILTGCGVLQTISPPTEQLRNLALVHPLTGNGYKSLYSFKGGSGDGASPEAGLMNVKGTLYGTTSAGGANNYGTVFSISPSGTETVLYSFKGGSGDGRYPYAGLLNVNGTLYGTTDEGGAKDDGTVFAITRSGKETALYRFKGGSKDGSRPVAGLINVKGTLYGETPLGGNGGGAGNGTVFSITPFGVETVLYRFKGGSGDGESPLGELVNVNSTLYGTTNGGGANENGTVFWITTSGKETVLHSFGGSGDGYSPQAGLVSVNGTLYGTTFYGGSKYKGTVFSITPSDKETVLYSFKGGSATSTERSTAPLSLEAWVVLPAAADLSGVEPFLRSRGPATKLCFTGLKAPLRTAPTRLRDSSTSPEHSTVLHPTAAAGATEPAAGPSFASLRDNPEIGV